MWGLLSWFHLTSDVTGYSISIHKWNPYELLNQWEGIIVKTLFTAFQSH
jgi:hypothetical protein